MKTTGVLQSSSFRKCGLVTLLNATHPNVRKCYTSGLRPCQASYGVTPLRALVDVGFYRYMTVATASPQNVAGMPRLFSRLHAMATTDWFLHSTTMFCCGMYGVVCCRSTPCSVQ
jgi:hypothetical protein